LYKRRLSLCRALNVVQRVKSVGDFERSKATRRPTCTHTSFCSCVQRAKCASGARLGAHPAIKPALCTYLPNQHNTTFIAAGPQGTAPDKESSAWKCGKKRCVKAVPLKWVCACSAWKCGKVRCVRAVSLKWVCALNEVCSLVLVLSQ
jgi:hypothetical protein